jgi:serine/threonine protein kinase
MEGGELNDFIQEQKRFSEIEVREIIFILIDSIRYCH